MSSAEPSRPWYSGLSGYHWFVIAVCALGWLFDTMDQQLFVLNRVPALQELITESDVAGRDREVVVREAAANVTAVFLLGWATGGLLFGMLGDVIGRTKTMLMTILLYSIFTGLSSFSLGFWDFTIYRFLTGLGVGGEFAVGVALLSEALPERSRPYALALVQALSAVGNISAALVTYLFGWMGSEGMLNDVELFGFALTPWRCAFLAGSLPALLAIVIRAFLKEPQKWREATMDQAMGARFSKLGELFSDARWRYRAFIGLVIAASGVIGLWGIGFFAFDLIRFVLNQTIDDAGLVNRWVATASVLMNIGAFFGIYMYGPLSERIGRRPTFMLCFVIAAAATLLVFSQFGRFNGANDIYWMMPMLGFCILSLFGGFAVYLPELFPTRLRSTGTSFCYNVGRYVAAAGPALLGLLQAHFQAQGFTEPMRPAGMLLCSVFAIGLVATFFAPETKGQPLVD
jgi:MFS family permease